MPRMSARLKSAPTKFDAEDLMPLTRHHVQGLPFAAVRERICQPLGWMGVAFDAAANVAGATRISEPDSRVAVCVIPTNEEWMIARHTDGLLS